LIVSPPRMKARRLLDESVAYSNAFISLALC
jgi:hypothetical protein